MRATFWLAWTVAVMHRVYDEANDWDDVEYNWAREDPSWVPQEVYPRLWQGGTPDDDLVVSPGVVTSPWRPSMSREVVDACVTLTPVAAPTGTGVAELRVTFADSRSRPVPLDDVAEAAVWAASRWSRGDRVVVRCRAGLNRSGLVAALVVGILEPQWPWPDVVGLLREKRHALVLCNEVLYEAGESLLPGLRSLGLPSTARVSSP